MHNLKKILILMGPIVYITIMMGFVTDKNNQVVCRKITVHVLDSLTNNFIDPKDVMMILEDEGLKLTGLKMNRINAQHIEDFIDKHPSIFKSECYKAIDGTFRIDIRQRRPLIRVMSDNGNYYIDSDGEIMPFSKHYTAFVPVATGKVNSETIKAGLFDLGKFIDENPFWKAQISQIDVRDEKQVIMIPRVGNHVIEFGSLTNISRKFNRLETLYKEKFNKEGWNRYKKISVKFENQVVCTKK